MHLGYPPFLCAVGLVVAVAACDKEATKTDAPAASATSAATTATTPAPPEPPRAPDIVIDAASVAIGNDHVATGELGLTDKIAVFLRGRPMIEGQTVSVVAMRPTRPSSVVSVISALRKAKATGAVVKTDARDGTTQKLPVSFATSVPDCATAAWIARDAGIEVWPAGGGPAHKVIKGLAGPDMTLGTEAIRKQASGCNAGELVVGADDVLTWGLVFDLATMTLQAPGARASAVVLVTAPSPGRKLQLE